VTYRLISAGFAGRARHLRERDGRRLPRPDQAEEQRGTHCEQRGDHRHARVEGEHDRQRAGDRPDPRHVEELPGDCLPRDPLGVAAAAGQRASASRDRGDRREGLLLLAPVQEIQRRDPVVRETGRTLPEHDEAIGLGEGEGRDERGVYQAEHRAVGADIGGKHDEGDGGPGRAPERTRGVAEVAPDRDAA